jgi:hypothetical protein
MESIEKAASMAGQDVNAYMVLVGNPKKKLENLYVRW